MNIKKYIAYSKVVETGSLTKAAEALHYTQPSISQMIHSLEEEYGFPLLIRQQHGVVPTAHGEQLLVAMREIERGYAKLTETVDRINGFETGHVRIGAYSSVTTTLLPPLLAAFKRDYPRIHIQLYEGNAVELDRWLMEDKIDMALGTTHNEHWQFDLLMNDPIVAIMHPDHPLAVRETISVAEAAHAAFILPHPNSHLEVRNLFTQACIQPLIAYEVKGDETILAMVKHHLGISFVPQLLLQRTQGLAVRPLAEPACRQLGLLTRRAKHTQTPAVKKMIDYIVATIASQQLK